MKKVFIDGSEGTTGLRIFERFEKRDDIELLKISSELRKDPEEISKFINESDITFLCLPDAAAREAVQLCTNPNTIIIDTSTAHRTNPDWAYGYPELSPEHRNAIRNGKRIAVPGCHATGFITLVYPLIANGVMPKDYPVSAFSLTGYSGGGKKMIAEYEGEDRDKELSSPRVYGLSQKHKHLPEMMSVCGLEREPLFSPIVADYYSGMLVTINLYSDMLNGKQDPESIHKIYENHYKGEKFIKVNTLGAETESRSFLGSNNYSGYDGIEIFVTGNEDRISISSRFDNLGKGASGAAIQCLNVVLGCDEGMGLNI